MVRYTVTDTELTSIANAIRTAGGTDSPLEFPSEFITAIGDIAVPGINIPTGIEVGSFTVVSNANTITVNHSFGHVPKIAVVIAALPEGWSDTLFFELLGSSPLYGDYDNSYTASQKLDSVTRISYINDEYNYQTTNTYSTYPASMTDTSITFVTGRYYNAQFVPGVTYFYVIGG